MGRNARTNQRNDNSVEMAFVDSFWVTPVVPQNIRVARAKKSHKGKSTGTNPMVNSTWFMYALISFATALDVAPQTPHRRMVSNEYSSQGGTILLGTATSCSWWSIDIGCSFTS